MTKVIFLDRDGVLNENREDYVKSWDEVKILPGAIEAVTKLKENGYTIIVVSNQSAVGKGLLDEGSLRSINKKLNEAFTGKIDDFFYCPHKPDDGCACRKPRTRLLIDAAVKYDVDLKGTWMIGDNFSDILLGQNAGCKTILVKTGLGKKVLEMEEVEPDHVAEDILDAVKWLLGEK